MEKLKEYILPLVIVVLVGLVGVLAIQPPTVVKVSDGQTVEVLGGVSDFTNLNVKSGGAYYLADTVVIDSDGFAGDVTGDVTGGVDGVMIGNINAISTTSATYTLTAADICDSTAIVFTAADAEVTVTLPATTTLFADCLATNGDVRDLVFINGGSTTSTILAAGAGGGLGYTSSTTIAASGKAGLLSIVRASATQYYAYLTNMPN